MSSLFQHKLFCLNIKMLELLFTNTKVNQYPKIKIFVDEDLMEELQLSESQQLVKIPIAQSNGRHELRVEHFGKTNADTEFVGGKIINDTTFHVTDLTIDGFKISDEMLLDCQFIPDWNNLDKPGGFPDVLPQVRTVGPNGNWIFSFTLPVEDWLMQRIHSSANRTTESYAVKTGQMEYELSPHSTMYHKLDDSDYKQIARIKKLING